MPPFYHALQLADPPTSLQFMQELLKYRPNIHFRDSFGNTFLHHCCYFDNCSTFQLLAERGVDSSVKNIYGQSILFAIAKNNNQ
jgi:ankyrin repeat protein